MDAEAMRARTKQFALRIIRLVRRMPRSVEGRALAQQIVRSGTSIGANYVPHAEGVREQNSPRNWPLLWRRRMRQPGGSN